MGNEFGMMGGWDGDGVDRSCWKEISDAAYRRLNEAKLEFIQFVKQYSFENISDADYQFTKKHAIKLHLVGKLRPKFNQYVLGFGANPKWVKLSDAEKKSFSKYKNRKSAVYFCSLTIDKNVKQKIMEKEADAFNTKKKVKIIPIETTEEYQNDPNTKNITINSNKTNEKKRKLEILDLTEFATKPNVAKKRKLENIDNGETVENENDPIDFKGVPEKFRKYKWLYLDCNALTDDGRKEIIDFLYGKYKNYDVEKKDILLKTVESVEGNKNVTKNTVFRMCFDERKWKKVSVVKKRSIAKKKNN